MRSRVSTVTSSRQFGNGCGASLGRFRDNAPRLRCVGVFPLVGVIPPRFEATRTVPNRGVCGVQKDFPEFQNITSEIALMCSQPHANCV